MKMKIGKRAFFLSVGMFLLFGILLTSFLPNHPSIDRNVMALSANDGYPLGDCWYRSSMSGVYEYRFFCNEETEEMTLYSCEIGYGVNSIRTDKCVRDKY